jgi:hypothetical protein
MAESNRLPIDPSLIDPGCLLCGATGICSTCNGNGYFGPIGGPYDRPCHDCFGAGDCNCVASNRAARRRAELRQGGRPT